MKHSKTNTKITKTLVILLALILSPAVHPKMTAGLTLEPKSSVNVSASIADTYLTVTGYSSADAKVELEGQSAYALTFSDDTGYFIFDHLLMPKDFSELCLTATDTSSRQSTPLCLPPISAYKNSSTVGPVLLPPTISIDSANVDAYSTTFTSGESIPNSTVTIHLYQATNDANLIVKPVEAFSFPTLTTKSDSSGHYSFSLPTTYSSDYRLYTSVDFQDNLSPKSNTLTYKLPTQFSWLFFVFIPFIFLLLLLLIIYFIIKNKHATTRRTRASTTANTTTRTKQK